MDVGNISASEIDPAGEASEAKFRWVPIAPKDAAETRPIPEITAEIRRDMDNLCDWLHEVQRVHSAMVRLRAKRRESLAGT